MIDCAYKLRNLRRCEEPAPHYSDHKGGVRRLPYTSKHKGMTKLSDRPFRVTVSAFVAPVGNVYRKGVTPCRLSGLNGVALRVFGVRRVSHASNRKGWS